jgi:hypothetical protein
MGCESSKMQQELANVSNCIEKINAELSTVRELLIEKNEKNEKVEVVDVVQKIDEPEDNHVVDILHSIQNRLERIETIKKSPPGILW